MAIHRGSLRYVHELAIAWLSQKSGPKPHFIDFSYINKEGCEVRETFNDMLDAKSQTLCAPSKV